SASHQYLDDNPSGTGSDVYPISVTVTDDDAGAGSASTSVTVNNVAPAVTAVTGPTPSPGVRGQTLSFGGAFTDVGTQDTHTASFDWGDGSSSPAALSESNGSGSVSASHVYTATGTYTVTLTVQDDDGGVHATSETVTIVAVALQDDPDEPGMTALAVGGTLGDDVVTLTPVGSAGAIEVTINGVSQGVFTPTGR